MKFLSVCSGIEAASVAWNPLGWEAIAFSEIEPFPSAVLNHHYPNIPNLGDMTKYREWPDTLRFDLLCGGTPCQAFSLAGLRGGMADPRGNLSLVFLGILERFRPRWVVWENVPGVFSSLSHDAPDPSPPQDPVDVECDGQEMETDDEYDAEELHAFQCLLAGFSELGYGVSYRTLDAQYVRVESHARAVPQRRRRVFIVGYLGDWRRAAAVLFEPESLRGDSPPRRIAGQDVAGTLTRSSLEGGSPCGGDGRDGALVSTIQRGNLLSDGRGTAGVQGSLPPSGERDGLHGLIADDVAPTLDCRAGRSGETTFHTSGGLVAEVAPTLSARTKGGGGLGTDFDLDGGLVAGTVTAKWAKGSGGPSGDECQNLVAAPLTCNPYADNESRDSCLVIAPALAFDCKASGQNGFGIGEVAPTLRAMGHTNSNQNAGGQVAVCFSIQAGALRENPSSGPDGIGVQENLAYTLEARSEVQAVAFAQNQLGEVRTRDAVGTLATNSNPSGRSTPMMADSEDAVRRLTPKECERLQGFKDDYTRIPWGGRPAEECPDGPRYRALGNSWAVNCPRWIGERIAEIESLSE